MTQPGDLVSYLEVMDPATEELIRAVDLQNGMRVISPNLNYFSASDVATPHFLRENRWCLVTQMQILDDRFFFIGVYSDGTKFQHEGHYMKVYRVKKDTLPASWAPKPPIIVTQVPMYREPKKLFNELPLLEEKFKEDLR